MLAGRLVLVLHKHSIGAYALDQVLYMLLWLLRVQSRLLAFERQSVKVQLAELGRRNALDFPR